jgi:virginiamycin A acetyltransferase
LFVQLAKGGSMAGPDPTTPHPMPGHPRVGFLKAFVNQPNIEIGDFTYYDDPRGP